MGHRNLKAEKAHQQMLEIMKIISLPEQMIKKVRMRVPLFFEQRLDQNKKILHQKSGGLAELKADLSSV